MAYADRNESGTRVTAAVIVAILMAVLGYAFVTGLAYQYVKKAAEKLNTFDVAPPPPPPPDEPPPPPPPDQPQTPPPVVSPPPIVRNPNPPPVVIQTVTTPPPRIDFTPKAAPPAPPPPPPAPPPKPSVATPAKLRTNLGDIFTADLYPASARRDNIQGRVGITVVIGPNGRISSCSVSNSSGNSDLDSTTCRIAMRSMRYDAAKDANGTPIESTVRLGVKWQLAEE